MTPSATEQNSPDLGMPNAIATSRATSTCSNLPHTRPGELAQRSAAYMTIPIGPLAIDVLDVCALTNLLISHALQAGPTQHVITANAQFYNLAEQRKDFRDCTGRAQYVCADGVSIVIACRWLAGAPVMRVPGVDLVQQLCKQAHDNHLAVYFLGGKEGAATMAADVLAKRYPGFRLAGSFCPSFGFEKDEKKLRAVLDDIRRVNPAIVFVALGAPRQEFFIDTHLRSLDVPVAIGVGGSFEMIAGFVHRAPQWIQRAGLEWVYRWVQEPRRLARRYLVGNLQFSFYLLRYLLKGQVHLQAKA